MFCVGIVLGGNMVGWLMFCLLSSVVFNGSVILRLFVECMLRWW